MSTRSTRAFSLLELLISTSAVVLVGAGIAAGVTNFTQRNVREVSVDEVQVNLRRALRYVARDVKDSVYIYNAADLAGRVPTLTGATAVPVLAYWRRRPQPTPPPAAPDVGYQQVVYYQMPPPVGSDFFGPFLVARAVMDVGIAIDTNNDRYLSPTEALAGRPTGCAANAAQRRLDCGVGTGAPASVNVFVTEALVDRLSAAGLTGTTLSPNTPQANRTVLLDITADPATLVGNGLLTATERNQLHEQIVATMRNR